MALDVDDEKIVANIAEYGFFSQGVLGDGDHPAFRYSVGFWESIGSPEVLIYGLNLPLMHNMLWEIFRQIQAGAVLSDGQRWSNLIEGYDCISRPIDPSQLADRLGYAMWYRRYRLGSSEGLEAYQLFWPGKDNGLYPWDDGCHAAVRDHQPMLHLPTGVRLQ